MSTYTVQHNDSPASIARKLTGSQARMKELVLANPGKPWVSRAGQLTFGTLATGERLNLPRHWSTLGPRGLNGIGLGDVTSDANALVAGLQAGTVCNATDVIPGQPDPASIICYNFQVSFNAVTNGQHLDEDGKYGPNTEKALETQLGVPANTYVDCARYTEPDAALTTAADLSAVADEVAGDFTVSQCQFNANVAAFQDAYNAANGTTLGIAVDYGYFTAPTQQAMANLPAGMLASYLTVPAACATGGPGKAASTNWGGGGGGTTSGGGGGGSNQTEATPPPATSSSTTYWLVGSAVVVAGLGLAAYVHHKKSAVAPAAPASSDPSRTALVRARA